MNHFINSKASVNSVNEGDKTPEYRGCLLNSRHVISCLNQADGTWSIKTINESIVVKDLNPEQLTNVKDFRRFTVLVKFLDKEQEKGITEYRECFVNLKYVVSCLDQEDGNRILKLSTKENIIIKDFNPDDFL